MHLRDRAGLTYTLGRMTGSPRHGWAVWSAMAILFLAGVLSPTGRGQRESAACTASTNMSAMQSGGNMEGKEVRFGIANSALRHRDHRCQLRRGQWMHDSFTPLGGMVPLVNIC